MEHIKGLIEALPGVEFAHVTINWTLQPDKKMGLPAASCKVYVKGGKKKQIARTIWENKPIGLLLLGNTKVNLIVHDFWWPVTFERLL